jgi:hypothetical protein
MGRGYRRNDAGFHMTAECVLEEKHEFGCIIESRKRFLEIGTGGGYRHNDAGFQPPSESWRRSMSLDSLEVLSILLVLYKTD